LRVDRPEVSTEFVEEAVDGGERRSKVGRGGASLGQRGAALRNLGEEDLAGSVKRSCEVLPVIKGATANGSAES
jgi:hypothetical protein